MIRLLHETGARVRELAHVKVKEVDIEERIIWLYDSKTEPRPAFFSPETQEMLSQLRQSKTFWEGDLSPRMRGFVKW
jgi:integrase